MNNKAAFNVIYYFPSLREFISIKKTGWRLWVKKAPACRDYFNRMINGRSGGR